MKKNNKKWWMINLILSLIVLITISFILYVLYCTYAMPRPISLKTIIANPNLITIKTNGSHRPAESHIKVSLKKQYPRLNINKIRVKNNISSSSATITSSDYKHYRGFVTFKYTLDKSLNNHIDLNQQYVPNSSWFYQRNYKGLWINKHNSTYQEQNLTNAFLMQAQYNDLAFYEKDFFISYEQLVNFLYDETKRGWQQVINNFCPAYQGELKRLLVKFYNFISNIWNQDIVKNFVRVLQVRDIQGSVVGMTYLDGFNRVIVLEPGILSCSDKTKQSWWSGWWASDQIFGVIFHELGHIVDFNFSRGSDVIKEIKTFLTKKINNASNLTPERILELFHLSSYSFNNLGDFTAEGFSYWFLAANNLKIKAWELWHEFLTSYLPQIIHSPH